jgi:glyoxylase I family protein
VEIRGIVFAGIATDDPRALAAFFRDALGLRLVADDEVFMLAAGDATLAVVPRSYVPPPSDTNLGLLVDDVEAATAELAGRGVEPDGPLLESDAFRYRHFRAPDGRRFELVERRRPA